MRIRAILSAAGLALAGLAFVPFSTAHAGTWESGVTLPLTSYYQMAVDNTHDRLFFSEGNDADFHSGGSTGDTILVTDFAGKTVATLTGEAGVMGIALSPDDGTLYAALSGAHEVVAISTATLQQTAVYPLGDTNTPYMVAVQSGKLWVSYYTGANDSGGLIGDFDLSATNPAMETQSAMGGWGYAPMIAADPAGTGNVLIAIDPYINTPDAASYDTAADPVTARAVRAPLPGGNGCYGALDLIVIPGGAQFAAACDNDNDVVGKYSTANLSDQGSYNSGLYPDAVAFAPNTGVVAVGDEGSADNIIMYTPGGDNTLGLRSAPGGAIAARGLGLTPDGSKLFAVADYDGSYTLGIMDEPAIVPSALTITAPASALPDDFALLSGSLSADVSAGNDGVVAGAAITITRTGPGGTETLTATTNAMGIFGINDVPADSGTYTYTARYAGSPNIAPAVATTHLTVKKVPPLTISVTPKTGTYPSVMHISIHLGTADSDRSVTLYTKTAGATKLTLLKTATVNSAGNLTLSYSAPHTTTFYARYTGDAAYAPRTVTAGASVAAAVSTKLGGYYASERVGSVTYRLYHRTKKLAAAVLVAPNKHGECVKFDLQELYKGKWYDSLTGCGTLAKNSVIGGNLTLSKAALGSHYRIRAEYERGKDTTNLSADSGWQYFIVEK